jgi:hypothetical protein
MAYSLSSAAQKENVSTFFRPIKTAMVMHIKQLDGLYAAFRESTLLNILLSDLSRKSGVILATRKSDDRIVASRRV